MRDTGPMTEGAPCCFDDWARHDARRARRRGRPDTVTRSLLQALDASGLQDRTVLEVGCGAGELVLACLDRGASSATGTDLGAGAVEEARKFARERGLSDRARFTVADGSSAPLATHDVVVLNRVICCFPHADRLVDHTVAVTGRTYAFVVPRSAGMAGVVARGLLTAGNAMLRLMPRKFGDYRAFVHDVDAIDQWLRDAGLSRVHLRHVRGLWHLAVYQREG